MSAFSKDLFRPPVPWQWNHSSLFLHLPKYFRLESLSHEATLPSYLILA